MRIRLLAVFDVNKLIEENGYHHYLDYYTERGMVCGIVGDKIMDFRWLPENWVAA